ncbi:MAG: NAD(P)/FAD-dependent oxidoreductase, partial [Demequina sp.]
KARGRVDITLVDRRPYMTYQPFLPETAAASIEPRHAVVPLRPELTHMRVVQGRVSKISHADHAVTVATDYGDELALEYDQLIVGLGSVSRTLPVPGLKEFGQGFKYVEEAIHLRNKVLGSLARAATTDDPATRQRLLTFVFVGGGFAGIEAFSEAEDMAKAALRYHRRLEPGDLRFIMVEATDRILPEMGPQMGEYTLRQLRRRGMTVHMQTFLEDCTDGHIRLSNGDEFEASMVVWTAGVKPNPVLQHSDLPLGEKGHVRCLPTLQVCTEDGTPVDGVWAAGDCAQIPDLTQDEGTFCAPSAQHAVRQARHLGANVARALADKPVKDYKHKHLGMVASLGLNKGVANILGVKLRGWPAWFMHRTYHMAQIPTMNRKARIVLDWTAAVFFRRDLVSMGRLHEPRRAFLEAAQDGAD